MSVEQTTLSEFARLYRLTREERTMLKQLSLGGRQPTTVAGWRVLFDAIRLVCCPGEFVR